MVLMSFVSLLYPSSLLPDPGDCMSGMAVSVVAVKKQGRRSVLCTGDSQTGCRPGDKAVHLILEA